VILFLIVANPGELVGCVFLSTVSVPAVVSLGFAGNSSPLGLGDGGVNFSGSVILESGFHDIRGLTSGIRNENCSGNAEPRERLGGVFRSSVRVPAIASFGLAGNFSVRSVSDGAVDYSGSVVLVSLSGSSRSLAVLGDVVESERLDDPREVGGGVFLSAVCEPSLSGFSLGRNVSPLSVSNDTVNLSGSVVLSSAQERSRGRLWALHEDGVPHVDEREIRGAVFLSAVRVPARARVGFSGNLSVFGVGYREENVASSIVLGSLDGELVWSLVL